MGRSQRDKGARGEREWRDVVRRHGFEAKRHGRHFHGLEDYDHEDVTHNINGVHFEVKRCERVDVWSWMDQAIEGAKDKNWAVAFRKNRRPWLVLQDGEAWLQRERELEDLKEALRNEESSISG